MEMKSLGIWAFGRDVIIGLLSMLWVDRFGMQVGIPLWKFYLDSFGFEAVATEFFFTVGAVRRRRKGDKIALQVFESRFYHMPRKSGDRVQEEAFCARLLNHLSASFDEVVEPPLSPHPRVAIDVRPAVNPARKALISEISESLRKIAREKAVSG